MYLSRILKSPHAFFLLGIGYTRVQVMYNAYKNMPFCPLFDECLVKMRTLELPR